MSFNNSYNTTYDFNNNTGGIEDFNVHYYYYYVHPVFTSIAIIMSLICAIVFAQRDLLASGPFFQYSFANSIGAVIGMAIFLLFTVTRCGPLCPATNYTYWTQLYEIYVVLFIDSALFFASTLTQISISFQLYFSVTNKFKRLNSVSPVKVIVVILIVSFVFGLSFAFSFKTVPIDLVTIENGTVTARITLYENFLDFENSPFIVYIALFTLIVSNELFLVILVVINVLLYIELRKLMKKKEKLTNGKQAIKQRVVVSNRFRNSVGVANAASVDEINPRVHSSQHKSNEMANKKISLSNNTTNNNNTESQRKTLIMVLWVSLFFCTGRFVSAVATLILLLMQATVYNWWASAFNFFFMAVVYASYFFVYMRTNKLFRKKFYKIFLRKEIA